MTGLVIDISTGKLIERLDANDAEKRSNSEKSIMEIVAPNGRRVFSIGRHPRESNHSDDTRRFAA